MDEDDPPFSIPVAHECGHLTVDASALRNAIIRTLRRFHCRAARISVAVVNDARIADLNMEFLGHAGPTDCITFNLSDGVEGVLDGEIVLSGETAVREAARRGHPPLAEALLYAIHGTLHLLGMDDATQAEARRMHRVEDEVLAEIGMGPIYTVPP